jgi:carbon starvation protein CstA
MLVIFAYFLALTPNQQISNFNIIPYALITLLTFSALTYTTNIKIPTFSDISQGNSILYISRTAPFLILLALILLLTIVIVVKLTRRSRGPLRPFSP